jgi:hypothetical protein
MGVLRLWALITLCANLRLWWGLNQSCSPFQELFNDMSHATYTQGNLVDSRLLVVGSQTVNLIPDLSFGHNLCFRCSNESCDPILDICVSIVFQWYKELFKAMDFDIFNCSLKIWKSTRTPTPKVRIPLGVWRSIPSHFLALPRACLWLLGFLLARNLAILCLGREPKAKVAIVPTKHFLSFVKVWKMW